MMKYIQQNEARLQVYEDTMKTQIGQIASLQMQLGQLTSMLVEKNQSTLPGNLENRPNEQAKVITLRSTKELREEKERQEKQPMEEIAEDDEKR